MLTVDELKAASVWADKIDPRQLELAVREIVVREFGPGEPVCRMGESVEYWNGLIDGLVKMNKFSAEGKSITFAGIAPGGWWGEGSLLKRELRRYDVTALRRSRVAFMPRATFERLLDSSIPFNRFLLVQLNERLGQFIAAVDRKSTRLNSSH